MPLSAACPALHRPRTLAEACELLAADERAMAYGGGTAIEVRRRQDPGFASAFVDLSLIPGLDRLSAGDTGLRVGPMVTIRRMETDPLVARVAPLAAAAYGQVANPRVRNAASVGGNLAYGPYRLDPPAALLVSARWSRPRRYAAPGASPSPGSSPAPGARCWGRASW
jgi:aerobic carbon-monoxide dehydrogenase medium subunit